MIARLLVTLAAALGCAAAAQANITVEARGRIAGGSLDQCGAGLSPCPWAGVRAGDVVYMTFEMTEPGTVLSTYPNGDIRRSEFVPGTFQMTIRGQPLALKLTNAFNPVVNITNNAPVADGFYIFGAADVVGLIPVGAPVTSALVYNMSFEISQSTGNLWSSSVPADIVGTYPAGAFDFTQWSLDYGNSSAAIALDSLIISQPGAPTGACCPGDGFCVVTSQAGCLTGSWTGGGACSPGLCPAAGACCLPDGGCVLRTGAACASSQDAIYQGDNTACGAPACPPAGACCLGNFCLISIESACDAVEGTWLGQYVTCNIVPQHAHYYQHTPPQPGDALLPLTDATFGGGTNPDTPGVTTSTVTLTDPTVIQNLEVWVGMYHGRLMDVKLQLTGPNGTTVELLNRFGSTNNCTTMPIGPGHSMDGNFIFQDDAPQSINDYLSSLGTSQPAFGGRYKPTSCGGAIVSLSAPSPAGFGGIPLAGTWTLTITDAKSGVTGNLGLFGLSVNGGNPEPCTQGACCTTDGPCAVRAFAECGNLGGTWAGSAGCTPDPCTPQTGACCRGSTCAATTADACTGANSSFAGAGTVCNAFGVNNTSPCCLADYNHAGGVTVQDIFDFLNGYFTFSPQADINGAGGVTVQDIFDFLSAYFGGGC